MAADWNKRTESEQAKDIERLKEKLKDERKYSESKSDLCEAYEKENEKLDSEIRELKSQLEAKAVDVEELRKTFFTDWLHGEFDNDNDRICRDTILNFFLPYLQPGNSDAVEFGEWIAKKSEQDSQGWYYKAKHFTTEELYQQYLKEKK